jgi:hypothetical protein
LMESQLGNTGHQKGIGYSRDKRKYYQKQDNYFQLPPHFTP